MAFPWQRLLAFIALRDHCEVKLFITVMELMLFMFPQKTGKNNEDETAADLLMTPANIDLIPLSVHSHRRSLYCLLWNICYFSVAHCQSEKNAVCAKVNTPMLESTPPPKQTYKAVYKAFECNLIQPQETSTSSGLWGWWWDGHPISSSYSCLKRLAKQNEPRANHSMHWCLCLAMYLRSSASVVYGREGD